MGDVGAGAGGAWRGVRAAKGDASAIRAGDGLEGLALLLQPAGTVELDAEAGRLRRRLLTKQVGPPSPYHDSPIIDGA